MRLDDWECRWQVYREVRIEANRVDVERWYLERFGVFLDGR